LKEKANKENATSYREGRTAGSGNSGHALQKRQKQNFTEERRGLNGLVTREGRKKRNF